MPIDEQIKQLEWELKQAKKRRDVGVKRVSYNKNLPKRYLSYLKSANSRGIRFNLTVDEFDAVIGQNCVYCGGDSKIGVDRIDSGMDYEIDNVQACCSVCNLMKKNYSHSFFLRHVLKIAKKGIW